MNEPTGTITDPVWADIVIGLVAIVAVMALFAIVEAVIHAVVRRWRETGSQLDQLVADGLEEIDGARWDAEMRA